MGPVQTLLVVLLFLSLTESVMWVRPGVWFFRRRGRGWELASPRSALVSTARGALHWVYPIPGLGRAYLVTEPGLATPLEPTPPGGLGVCDDQADRVPEIRQRRAECETVFRPLRWTTLGLLVLIWVVTPILLGWGGIHWVFWGVLPELVILMAVHAWMVSRLHRRVFPGLGDERIRLVLSGCLSPLSAVRSMDLAHKSALEGFHPLAVAAALPRFEGWEDLAASQWRRLKYQASVADSSPEAEVMMGGPGAERSLALIETLARQRGLDPSVWDAPPNSTDPANTQYCPRCRTQFTRQATQCHDCRWPKLKPLPS